MKFRADDGSEIDLTVKGDVLHIDVRLAAAEPCPTLRLTGDPLQPVMCRVRGNEALAIAQGLKRRQMQMAVADGDRDGAPSSSFDPVATNAMR